MKWFSGLLSLITSSAQIDTDDLVETTRVAIEAYETSLKSLAVRVEVAYDPESATSKAALKRGETMWTREVLFWAEDLGARHVFDNKAYAGDTLVFHEAACHDGSQGHQLEFDDADPNKLRRVTIDRHWSGDAGSSPLPYPLYGTRFKFRLQPWRPYSELVATGSTRVLNGMLEFTDAMGHVHRLSPDRSHAFLPSRVTVEFDKNKRNHWTVASFEHNGGRWFPMQGTFVAERDPVEGGYIRHWKVTDLTINEAIPAETFRPPPIPDGVLIRNNISGQSYVMGKENGVSTAEPPATSESGSDPGGKPVRATRPGWGWWTIAAYVLGTASVMGLTMSVYKRAIAYWSPYVRR